MSTYNTSTTSCTTQSLSPELAPGQNLEKCTEVYSTLTFIGSSKNLL